jgi:hypothetical protein
LLGRELLVATPEGGADIPLSERLFQLPVVVLSHGTEDDPVLNYGNAAALALWERDWDTFTSIPSRLTAEPLLREERDRLLKQVADQGYVDDFSGVRISSTGRRYFVRGGIVWNLIDEHGVYQGQAAAFASYEELTEKGTRQ